MALEEGLLGLDMLFKTPVKLYIADVLKCTCRRSGNTAENKQSGIFFYKEHPITKVDVCGVVVKVERKPNFSKYTLDDSTGTICCMKWMNNSGQQNLGLPECLQEKMREVERSEAQLELGDYAHAIGGLKIYRDAMELAAEYIEHIQDPSIETLRMLEMPKLYQRFYDQPFKLPAGFLASGTTEKASDMKSVRDIVRSLLYTIQNDLVTSKGILCDIQELDILEEATMRIVTESNIETALEALVQEGFVYPHPTLPHHYKVVNFDEELCDAVITILKKAQTTLKYSEQGCHFMYVKDQLQKQLKFSKIQPKTVTHCMGLLEKRSIIFSVSSDKHFMLL